MTFGLILATLALAAACGDSQGPVASTSPLVGTPTAAVDADLDGTTWIATSVTDEAVLADYPNPTLSFESAERVTGSAGCNDIAGTYATTGGEITFLVGLSSRRPCQEPQGNQESRFLDALDRAARFQVTGGTLILSDVDGIAVATFDPA